MSESSGQRTSKETSTDRAQARRGVWVVVDQAASSAFNLVVGLAAVRFLTLDEFGTFAVYFASYLMTRGTFRALLLEPILILYPSGAASEHRPVVQGASLLAGVVAGLSALLVNVVLGNGLQVVAVFFGLSIAPLFWAESQRVINTARGKPKRAAILSSVMLVLFALAALVLGDSLGSLSRVLAVVAASSATAVLLTGGISRPLLSPVDGYRWIRSHSKIGLPLVGEYLASAGLAYVAIVVLAAISVTEAGVFRAGQMLIAPIFMLFVALTQHLVVEGSRLHQRAQPMGGLVKVTGSIMVFVGVTAVLITLSGDTLPRILLGDATDAALPVITPLAIHAALSSVSAVGSGILRAKNLAQEALKLRLFSAVPESLAIVVGASMAGARGVAVGAGIALLVAVPLWIRPILRTLDDRR